MRSCDQPLPNRSEYIVYSTRRSQEALMTADHLG